MRVVTMGTFHTHKGLYPINIVHNVFVTMCAY